MIVFPNAKINLGLNITGKREDSYHNLESVFYPIPLRDVLEVIKDPSQNDIVFSQSGIPIEGDATKNLCVKAYHLIRENFEVGGIKCHLHKNIPTGAGLGGGSSDAAFMIKVLDELFELEMSLEKKLSLALELGSDCPFFIHNKPCLVQGRGEIINEINFSLGGKFLMLIHPRIHVSTRDAYSNITPKSSEKSITEILNAPMSTWRDQLKNDFEETVFTSQPEIAELKKNMYSAGALYASMTGSGSVVFGLFNEIKNDFPDGFRKYFVYTETL